METRMVNRERGHRKQDQQLGGGDKQNRKRASKQADSKIKAETR
jgi:hypothetical protein